MITNPDQQLGLTKKEKTTLRKRLDREPNALEWAMVDAQWSEHCSYKSSKPVLSQLPTKAKHVLLGPGYDAGVVDVGDGYIVTFHIESHNHPSAIDPYGGSATGIGGVVRDILSLGTRPIALLDSLHFGDIKTSSNSRWLFKNVVKGIADYGNCIGVPTVGGEVGFDKSFEKNILVDVVCIGLGKKEDLVLGEAKYSGDTVILMGGSTGRDGIHGVTFASKVLSDESESERSAVQIPNPFLKKLIIEATLEAVNTGYVRGLKDLGGGGLTCGISEIAEKGKNGIDIEISKIPLREDNMTPIETLISESQERMLFVIKQGHEKDIQKIFDKYELSYAKIGIVKNNDKVTIKDGKIIIASLPVETIVNAPIINRSVKIPNYLNKLRKLEPPNEPTDFTKILSKLLSSLTLASKRWVYKQYDHEVGIKTVVKPGQSGAAVLKLDNGKFLAIKVDGNPKHCYLDPYNGAAGGLAEASRNIISVGGQPLAMVDHCQFGDPNNSEVFWTFSEAVHGMADYCKALNLPCVGGKVSFYNEDTGTNTAIKPSPIVSVIGLIDKLSHIRTMELKEHGDIIIELGITKPEMGGSEYYEYIHNFTGGSVPKVNFITESKMQILTLELIKKGLVNSVNDCSKGGLAIALVEMSILGEKGINIDLNNVISECHRIDDVLFSESHSRMIISTNKNHVNKILDLARNYDVPCSIIGTVKNKDISINMNKKEIISLTSSDISKVWSDVIPKCMGEVN